jgi:dihydroneopterin aldolase
MNRSPRSTAPNLSRRETLLFEAGIKLGGVFHQYLGIPVSEGTADSLSRAIEAAVGLQPFVRRAAVAIHPKRGGPLGRGRFAYRYLTPEMMDVTVQLADGPTFVEARLQHRPDLHYPLMKVVRMDDDARRPTAPSRRRRARPPA